MVVDKTVSLVEVGRFGHVCVSLGTAFLLGAGVPPSPPGNINTHEITHAP